MENLKRTEAVGDARSEAKKRKCGTSLSPVWVKVEDVEKLKRIADEESVSIEQAASKVIEFWNEHHRSTKRHPVCEAKNKDDPRPPEDDSGYQTFTVKEEVLSDSDTEVLTRTTELKEEDDELEGGWKEEKEVDEMSSADPADSVRKEDIAGCSADRHCELTAQALDDEDCDAVHCFIKEEPLDVEHDGEYSPWTTHKSTVEPELVSVTQANGKRFSVFQVVDDEEIDQLLTGTFTDRTHKVFHFAKMKLLDFAKFTGRDIGQITQDMTRLDKFLTDFYCAVRKQNGDAYKARSLDHLQYGIRRYFMENHTISISDREKFPQSNRLFKALLAKAKKQGRVTVHKPVVTDDDMKKIQNSLDISTPAGLLDKVFVDILMHFNRCSRDKLRSMKPTDFIVRTDDAGRRFVQMKDDDDTLMYSMPELVDRCPVRTFEKYVSKLNPVSSCMWQRPKDVSKEYLARKNPWYDCIPLGVNMIGRKLRKITQRAGCSRVYLNSAFVGMKADLSNAPVESNPENDP